VTSTPSVKRLLALDGGGVRGIFSIEVLCRLEAQLREKTGNPNLLLSDYFDYIAGSSTGAIIATCLSWGMTAAEVQNLYISRATEMFRLAPIFRRFWHMFEAEAITRLFKTVFSEDPEGKVPSLLGTKKLRTLLMLVMRNHTTGSPWPISNNPAAKFNDPASPECNLNLPLWQLVRASTAAPVFFPPETIDLGGRRYVFVDGGITPYNNPSFLLYLMATLPGYRLCWPTGVNNLLLVSVGTGRARTGIGARRADQMSLFFHAHSVPTVLADSINREQDMVCRTVGYCREGPPLDSEIGDCCDVAATEIPHRKFTYFRYDHYFTSEEMDEAARYGSKGTIRMDQLRLIPLLQEIGRRYAAEHVQAGDLL
jgi:uncharacterized protein